MSQVDNQVFIPGTGYLYVAPVGTAVPSSLTAPVWPWDSLGHTSLDNGITITRDGGDSNTLGTWQNPVLRERRDPVTFALTANLLQVANSTLELYFGGGDKTVDGVFGVPITPTPQERALFLRIVDGTREAPIFIPKASIASDDDVEVDPENFLEFPIKATILGVSGQSLMQFFGTDLGLLSNEVQTVAITGTPTGGTFTLSFAGQTTGTIAYNAAASAVASALAALTVVGGSANVAATGGPLPGSSVTVTFQGALAGQDVPQMTGSATGLTGGTTPAVTVTTGTPGGV